MAYDLELDKVEAKIKAELEYDNFRVKQDRDYISDFDREIDKVLKIKQ